jgi:hypothetical protein
MAAGFHPHLAGAWHRYTAKALGASMWFWMMYRAKQDMPVLLVCLCLFYHIQTLMACFANHLNSHRDGDTLGTATTEMNMQNTTRVVGNRTFVNNDLKKNQIHQTFTIRYIKTDSLMHASVS